MAENGQNLGVCWLPLAMLSNIPQEGDDFQFINSQATSQMEGSTAFLGEPFAAGTI